MKANKILQLKLRLQFNKINKLQKTSKKFNRKKCYSKNDWWFFDTVLNILVLQILRLSWISNINKYKSILKYR